MAVPVEIQQQICPLCRRPTPMGKKAKRLYKGYVCKKCCYSFVNRRQAAYLVDSLLYSFVYFIFLYFLNFMPGNPFLTIILTGTVSWVILVEICCEIIFYMKDGFRGKSPGRWIAGVTVVDEELREPIGFHQSVKRNLALLIPFGLLIIVGQMSKGKRIGDKWAKTRVIWDKYKHSFPFEDRGFVCYRCGYNLTGNVSGICPECGTAVSIPQARPILETPSIAHDAV